MFLEHFLLIFLIFQPVLAQQQQQVEQPSVIWDENTKSWVSAPTASVTATPTTPQTTPAPAPAPTVIQTVPPTPAPAAVVDLTTLTAVITPIIAAISGIFIKNRKDMEKKDEQVKEETIKAIEAAILPKLKQIIPVAEQTARQDVKISQIAEELYRIMAEKANEIKDKPEIQQQHLLEDAVRSKIIAEQAKTAGSMYWDDTKKEWVSK